MIGNGVEQPFQIDCAQTQRETREHNGIIRADPEQVNAPNSFSLFIQCVRPDQQSQALHAAKNPEKESLRALERW